MIQLNMDELRKYQLAILDVVTDFCDEHRINYWLDAGTLLGAVRHKGYIPWDDDIDLGMLRPDYDRFMREFNGHNPRYEFCCIENTPKWYVPFGKVLDKTTVLYAPDEKGIKSAVNIDIFPMDNAPDDDSKVKDMFAKRVGNFTGWQEAIINKEALMSFVEVEFEGKKYKAPAGYDEWLRIL